MHQDAPGLQLLKRQGDGHAREWTDAPVLPGAFLAIVGDVLERMTNGVARDVPHRVARTAHARNALIRFNAVSATTPCSRCRNSSRRRGRRATGGDNADAETTMQNLADGRGAGLGQHVAYGDLLVHWRRGPPEGAERREEGGLGRSIRPLSSQARELGHAR